MMSRPLSLTTDPVAVDHLLAFSLGWGIAGIWWGMSIVTWSAGIFALWWGWKVCRKGAASCANANKDG
jgi:Na+-driven multidrug efflux pump